MTFEELHSASNCQQTESLFNVFQGMMRVPTLPRQRGVPAQDIVMAPTLELDVAFQKIERSASQRLGGDFGRFLVNKLTASFDYLLRLQHLSEILKVAELSNLIINWHSYLDNALVRSSQHEKYVLCAFSAVEDFTLTLDQTELDNFVNAVAASVGQHVTSVLSTALTRAESGTNVCGTKLDDEVWDEIDLLATVISLMKRAGLKPAVRDPQLQDWLINYANSRQATRRTFGGAAGNEAFILRQLGFPVLMHTPYHHVQQAQLAPDCAKRLIFGPTGPIQPFPSLKQGDPDVARRFSVVLQLIPQLGPQGNIVGPTFIIQGKQFLPRGSDRVIPRIPHPRTNQPAGWQDLRVTWQGRTVTTPRSAFHDFTDYDWPYLPVFQHPPSLGGSTVHIELATENEMKKKADHVRIVLLGGIQVLGRTFYDPSLTTLLRDALVKQLLTLAGKGAMLHLELSGVSSESELNTLSSSVLQPAGIRSIGLNREELVQITSEFGSRYYAGPPPIVPESPYAIYCRAHRLLKELGLQGLYVHDPELDMVLIDTSAEETLATRLDQYRQAMLLAKAGVPETLFRRAGATSKWSLVLSTKSLVSLLEFAEEYARRTAKKQWRAVFDSFMSSGYHLGPDKVAVVVAPTIAVDLPPEVTLAGAGDMCFAAFTASL